MTHTLQTPSRVRLMKYLVFFLIIPKKLKTAYH